MPDLVPIARALVSVSDKTGVVEFARFLAGRGVKLVSTGGTAAELRAGGLEVVEVAQVTGFPEVMDGRVKTLHPKIHGAILARRDRPEHQAAMAAHGIAAIDLVAVNLYPFAATAASADFATGVENIDVGGPALIRAAAKNHQFVAVATEPGDYAQVMAEMAAHDGATTLALRRRLAEAAFRRTGAYDAAIAHWLAAAGGGGEPLPPLLVLAGLRRQVLKYGENPHQLAAFYAALQPGAPPRPGVATARQLQGKELGFNNLADADAAFELVAEFERPAAVIAKHANPCGVAVAGELALAYARARACDPASAYGGVLAVNRPLDAATAGAIVGQFLEVVIAPAFEPEALAALAAKENLRLLSAGDLPDPAAPSLELKSLAGGYLVQTRDNGRLRDGDLRVATRRAPTPAEFADLRFAWRVVKHVKSNAIVLAKDGATVGIGAGQPSRVEAARLAASKAGKRALGAVVASDAFFPFPDGIEAAAEAGATAAIQPGGSVRDAEVIAAADAAGMAMVFTGMRHFRH